MTRNVTDARTRGSKDPWSIATNSTCSVCSPGDTGTVVVRPASIDTSRPSSEMWTCPSFGTSVVEVKGTQEYRFTMDQFRERLATLP